MRHIVWLRQELRVADNPALYHASLSGNEVLPVYVWSGAADTPGAASRWWLHGSLSGFSKRLEALGAPLILLRGTADEVLPALARRCNADAVFWSRAYDPEGRALDTSVERALQEQGTDCRIFAGSNLLLNVAEIHNKTGGPFKVFTPFYRHAVSLSVNKPFPMPGKLAPFRVNAGGVSLQDLGLLPKSDWAAGLRTVWQPGEAEASARTEAFVDDGLRSYEVERDIPGHKGTSRLSPHLHFGEISPRTILYAVRECCAASKDKTLFREAEVFIRQLYWRDFAHHLLYHFPHMTERPMYPAFEQFPWRQDKAQLWAWQHGLTGYPIVDAGMWELWVTGWMHNRVRMIVGSFLVKDLLLPWQAGADWFRDTLVDADAANNTMGWQWVGGCGPDAAPYFRVFNPVLQSKRFDPDGIYIRQWVPQLARLKGNALHAPWTASASELSQAGITLGKEYPKPLVDHAAARDRALLAYHAVKGAP